MSLYRSLLTACLLAIPILAAGKTDRLVLVGASYGKNVLAICEADGSVIWQRKTGGPKGGGHTGHHDLQLLENGNLLFHDTWHKTLEMTLDGQVVWSYDSAPADVHAFSRQRDGSTMIAESGVGRMIQVDPEGKIMKETPLPKNGRHQTRMARLLENGHYLVCAENPGVVTEYDAEGKIVWEFPTNSRVFGAIRLRNGNTLIASGSGNSILEVTHEKKVVWKIEKKVPGTEIELAWTTDLQELSNGNIVIGNCHAGEKNPQIIEFDRDRKMVWSFSEWDLVGNGLACWEILEGNQAKLVRDLLAADTPLDLFEKRNPKHPALKFDLNEKSALEIHRLITDEKFLKSLKKKQLRGLVDFRDTLASNLRTTHPDEFPPPKGYRTETHLGWTVFIDEDFQKTPKQLARAMELLDQQLQAIIDRVPAPAVAYLKKVPLYFTYVEGKRSGACHHPSSRWLKENNFPVELAKSIEFTNVHDFEKETRRMPNFVLHELSHAYHNHILGDDHPGILKAFKAAKKSGRYVDLAKRTGLFEKPIVNSNGETYAMTNQMEYFAEATEAYFQENDFYPHDRHELEKFDPQIVKVIEDVWGVEKQSDPLSSASRIVVLGDSITANRGYLIGLQAALHLDGFAPEMIALGLPSEGVTGLTEDGHPFPRPDVHERLDRLLAATKPDLVMACYGMNDGIYHSFSNERFTAYQVGIQSLIDKCEAAGAEVILITPPPFDPLAPGQKGRLVESKEGPFPYGRTYHDYDNEVIGRYADWILKQNSQVHATVDIHSQLNSYLAGLRSIDPDLTLSRDGVHLNQAGHHKMAEIIYESLTGRTYPAIPVDLLKFYRARQNLLGPAWLSKVGHKRPGMKPGLPLPEAQAKAAFVIR